jgi:hypothetical protein
MRAIVFPSWAIKTILKSVEHLLFKDAERENTQLAKYCRSCEFVISKKVEFNSCEARRSGLQYAVRLLLL